MKKVTYYVVTNRDTDFKKMMYFSVCQSRQDCNEFINRYLLLENKEHYLEWCKLRKVDSQSTDNWNIYKKALELDKKFMILKTKVNLNVLLGAVRKSLGCPVIGCSYETLFEMSE